jgi:hypothetical protein
MTLQESLKKGWSTQLPGTVTDEFVAQHNLLIIRGWFADYVYTNTRENRLVVKKYHASK